MSDIIASLTPSIIELVGSVIGLVLSWLIIEIRRKYGVEIRVQQNVELDQLRQRLADVIWNAADAVVAKRLDGPVEHMALLGLAYVKKGAPDVLARLGASDSVLIDRLRAAIADRMAR